LTQTRHGRGQGETAGGPACLQQYDFFISFKFSNCFEIVGVQNISSHAPKILNKIKNQGSYKV
jgi:hypothetical protein